jgi:hypothetical protein
MTIVSIISGTMNMISGSKKENILVGCFFVDVSKRQRKRNAHKGIFTVSRVAKKSVGKDFLARPTGVPPPSPRKNSAIVKNIRCIHDVILQRSLLQQRTDGELFNKTPMRGDYSL